MTNKTYDITPDIAKKSKAWPFEEAKKVLGRLRALNRGEIKTPDKGYVLFETGYGPSGLPHIGTFGEVARTTMVLRAFQRLAPDIPVKLICFSDDMDGFRKVPSNVPEQEMLAEHLHLPLTKVPNPFGTEFDSYAAHNNGQLRAFLDGFGFEYDFYSGTDCYTSGRFDETLLLMLKHHEEIKQAVLPILGEERAATYSPFLPVSPSTNLHFDIIPKAIDEYIQFAEKLDEQSPEKKLENPTWYIHDGAIPASQHTPINFALLLNLTAAANTDDASVLWNFIKAQSPDASPENAPFLDRLVGYAITYYRDFILPAKTYRAPDERESAALADLASRLEAMDNGLNADEYMTEVFSAGKENGYEKDELRNWFQAIYEICLGQSQGPRFGSFIALYGVNDTAALIRDALNGKFMDDKAA